MQVGALPLRKAADGSPEILLVTTRSTKRWTIPKGWPIKGLKSYEAAGREAWEEAGIVGKCRKRAIGRYLYWKRKDDHFELCRVRVFPMDIRDILDDWPERDERQRHWFSLADAADLVEEPGLKAVLRML
ncbi:MAG: NUDIX hydrolase [Hyphomicrobiales bacterium]|nr:MAG: NUDIX hydrolase [Hyphomicrobiales bacterium]